MPPGYQVAEALPLLWGFLTEVLAKSQEGLFVSENIRAADSLPEGSPVFVRHLSEMAVDIATAPASVRDFGLKYLRVL